MHRLLATILALCALAPASAAADQRPPGCVSNSVSVAFTRDRATVRPGQTVTYTVSVGNVGGGACDVSDATVTFTPPGGTAVPLAEHLDLPAGTPPATVARPQWTVPAGRAAGDAVATTSVSGVLHDAPVDHTAAVTKTLGTLVVDPKVSLTLSATPDTGTAPLTVTYHYMLKNVSNPPDGVIDPEIDHPACDDIRYASGDAGVIDTIDGNETWEFTCTRVFDRGGTYSASAAVAATSLSDGEDVVAVTPLTTVTVNPPASTGHLTLQKVASPASGIAPLPVTFNYTVGNDGPVPISGITVADGGCAPVTTASPDTPLAPGASRGFTCNATFGVGTASSSAIASGIDTLTGTRVNSAEAFAVVDVARPPDREVTPVIAPGPRPATPAPSARVKFSYTGRFTPARSCKGAVTLTLKAGTKRLATKRVNLDRRCRYRVNFTIARSRLGGATTVTVTAKAARRTASRRLTVPTR